MTRHLGRRSFIGGLAALPFAGAGGARAMGAGLPVQTVVELFTSQGCSACPPADRLMHNLSKETGILGLSLPVTIWDYLGWKDTQAQKVFTERQKAYSIARGDRKIYTPQAVINGVEHAVGSDAGAIGMVGRSSALQDGVLALTPKLSLENGRWRVQVADGAARSSAVAGNICVVRFQRELLVNIGRGENSGRTMRYSNVVNSIAAIGEYGGSAVALDLPVDLVCNQTESFAIIIQAGSDKLPSAILGAVEAPRS